MTLHRLFSISQISDGDISGTGRPINFVFDSRIGFSGTADRMDLLPVGRNPRGRNAKFHDIIIDVIRSESTIREDHLDIPHRKISAYSNKNCQKRSILKMWTDRQTDRQTDPQTDTLTVNKCGYS